MPNLTLHLVDSRTSRTKKHEIFDDDLQVLVGEDASKEENDLVRFIGLKTMAETGSVPVAELSLELDGQPLSSSATGDGLVDAVFKAAKKSCREPGR